MAVHAALECLLNNQPLSNDQMRAAMQSLMSGEVSNELISGFLVALRLRGETPGQIAAAADVMRSLMSPVVIKADNAVDIVGTGGDGANLFNVSTAASVVVAAAGLTVAKHGNRSVSSSSGSADVLEAAGVNLTLQGTALARCIDEVGLGFMFAINHHPSMKYAIPARKALGVRTVFNLLGPLTNPASVRRQLVGVFDKAWVVPVAQALQELGSEHALVVHSGDGLDEFSLAANNTVAELRNGKISEYEVSASEVGLEALTDISALCVNGPTESLSMLQQALKGDHESAAQMVAFNAGAALYVGGVADSIAEGVTIALDIIASGVASEKLKELAEFSQLLGEFS